MIRHAEAALRPGGRLLILTPNYTFMPFLWTLETLRIKKLRPAFVYGNSRVSRTRRLVGKNFRELAVGSFFFGLERFFLFEKKGGLMLSVVLPTRNDRHSVELLVYTLLAILEEPTGGEFELLVVDDSNDGSDAYLAEKLKRWSSKVTRLAPREGHRPRHRHRRRHRALPPPLRLADGRRLQPRPARAAEDARGRSGRAATTWSAARVSCRAAACPATRLRNLGSRTCSTSS